MTNETTVLVVEDERELADMYALWLSSDYDVRVAYNGTEALDAFDGEVDVVLLDRRMPDISGDEVLTHIREGDADCRVAMVTAVEPDFDVFDMGFDDYVVKPIFEDELADLVGRLERRATYDRRLQRHFALASKIAVLEEHKDEHELAESEEYAELKAELERLDGELQTAMFEMTDDDVTALFREMEAGQQST